MSLSHIQGVSRGTDDNFDNQHIVMDNEEKFHITFFYEVVDMVSEFETI